MIWIGIDLLKGVDKRRLCLLKNHLKYFLGGLIIVTPLPMVDNEKNLLLRVCLEFIDYDIGHSQ